MAVRTSQIYSDIFSVVDDYPAVLLDAYGVFWGGSTIGVLPGAKEAMARLVADGKVVGILSNTTQLVAKDAVKLEKHGIVKGTHYHFLLTSGEATFGILTNSMLAFPTPRMKACLSGPRHPVHAAGEALFKDTPYTLTEDSSEADFIYLDVPHIDGEDRTEPDDFKRMCEGLAKLNLPILCSNPDRTAQEGNPSRFVVRQGTIARMCESMGAHIHYVGKPHPYVYTLARQAFEQAGVDVSSPVLMVGDNPETDIFGAKREGMHSALILRTGVAADHIEKNYGGDTLAFIEGLTVDTTPSYYLNQLGV